MAKAGLAARLNSANVNITVRMVRLQKKTYRKGVALSSTLDELMSDNFSRGADSQCPATMNS